MSDHIGFNTVGAFNLEAAYATPVACAAADVVLINPGESVKKGTATIKSNGLNGTPVTNPGKAGNVDVGGSLPFDLCYGATNANNNGLNVLFAAALGTAGAPAQQDTSDAYLHTWRMKKTIQGIFGTLGVSRSDYLSEFQSAKVGGFKISGTQGELVQVEFPIVAYDEDVASAINTVAGFEGFAIPEWELATFNHVSLFMNAQDGADFTGGDEQYISAFSVDFNRNIQAKRSSKYPGKSDEPVPGDGVTVTGSFDFPARGSEHSSILALAHSKTPQKMKLSMVGPTCDGAYAFEFHVWLNNVQISEAPDNVSSRGVTALSVQFEANTASAVPTGFPANMSEAIGVQCQNLLTADALA